MTGCIRYDADILTWELDRVPRTERSDPMHTHWCYLLMAGVAIT